MAELSGRDKGERSNIILRTTGGAECSNRGERVFKYTRPPLRSRGGRSAGMVILLTDIRSNICLLCAMHLPINKVT